MVEVNLKNISLEYPVYGSAPRMFTKKILSLASAGIVKSNEKYNFVKALNNIDLHLKPGDRLGIVGGNGAGKTTLLKTMAGIYTPTSGHRKVTGKITTLISTGFGLDDEATGYQNIILGGIALGFCKKEMLERFEDIQDFTELGEFLNIPIKTYSAGMKLRLAFAIATSIDPEILVIDEGIGAGDAEFYEKATKRVKDFLSKAAILVIASHSDDLLTQFCNKGIYMAQGEIVYAGTLKAALKERHKHIDTLHKGT